MNNMDKPKAMIGLQEEDYCYPLADVSHLSDEEKMKLRIRGMHIPKFLTLTMRHPTRVCLLVQWPPAMA